MAKDKLPVILIIVIAFFLLLNTPRVPNFPKGVFSVFSDSEEQRLASEYVAVWRDSTDLNIHTSRGAEPIPNENNDFRWSAWIDTNGEIVLHPSTSLSAYFTFKHNFYGQEVVVYYRSAGGRIQVNGQYPFGAPSNANHILSFIPRTLNLNKVDVYEFGKLVSTIDISNPMTIKLEANANEAIYVDFVGYKAQFQCNLAPDEVPIQQSFASPFNINNLRFPVTKWMYPCRPATLRDLQKGEDPIIPNPYPALNRKETLTPPENSIITVNYATPNVQGVTQPCDVDQANIEIAGKWVCSQVIKTTTLTREIPTREIIKVENSNSFIFTSTSSKNSFSIGNSKLIASLNYGCQLPTSDEGTFSFPNPSSNCYSSILKYGASSYNLKDKELISLNNHTKVQYFAGGGITRKNDGTIVNNLQGTFIFNIINPVDIDIDGGISFRHNQSAKLKIKIINNLPDNQILLKLTQVIKATNQIMPQEKELLVPTGESIHEFAINTENLGINEFLVQAIYPITADGEILLASDKIRINIEILQDKPSIVQFITGEPKKEIQVTPTPQVAPQSEQITKKEEIPSLVKILLGIIVFFVLWRI